MIWSVLFQMSLAALCTHILAGPDCRVGPTMLMRSKFNFSCPLSHIPRNTNMCRGILQETAKTETPHPPTSPSIMQLPLISAGKAIPLFLWPVLYGGFLDIWRYAQVIFRKRHKDWMYLHRKAVRTRREEHQTLLCDNLQWERVASLFCLLIFLFLHLSLIIWSFQSNTSLSLLKLSLPVMCSCFSSTSSLLDVLPLFLPWALYLPPSLNFFIFCCLPLLTFPLLLPYLYFFLSFSFHPSLSPQLSWLTSVFILYPSVIPSAFIRPSCRCIWPFCHKLVCVIPHLKKMWHISL